LRPWLLLLASAVIVGVTWARCPGCLDRSRLNETCGWTSDTAFPFDPNNPAHQQHLVEDGQLAEDLAGRYADAEHERLYGWHGHGGLIDHGRVVRECYARLVAVIEKNHAVTMEQINAVQPHRNLAFDLGVWLSFLPLYLVAAIAASGWLERHFPGSERPVRWGITSLASVAVSFLGVQLGAVWTMIGETIRLHNDHFGAHRAAIPPWPQHLEAVFALGVVLFWIVALLQRRVTSGSEATPSDVAIPHGILLR
jgi:hypothetical protein